MGWRWIPVVLSVVAIHCGPVAVPPGGYDPDGGKPAVDVTVTDALEPVASVHLEMGTAGDGTAVDDYLMIKPQFALSYNRFTNEANWVSWRLVPSDYGDAPRFSGNFFADTTLPTGFYRVVHDDYTNTGFDRGHMVRSEERTDTDENNHATFVTTNIVPQSPDLNRGPWLGLEMFVQTLVDTRGKDAYIVAGPVFPVSCSTHAQSGGNYPPSSCATIGRSTTTAERVAVPSGTFKIVVVLEHGQTARNVNTATRVIAVYMPNTGVGRTQPWTDFLTTVDEIEELTGYDFLTRVDRAVQVVIESRRDSGAN